MTTSSASRKGDNSNALASVRARKMVLENEQLRVQKNVEQLRSEVANLESLAKQREASMSLLVRRIEQNAAALRSAPSVERANAELERTEHELRELKKEKEFVERKSEEIQTEYQRHAQERSQKEHLIQEKDFILNQLKATPESPRYMEAEASKRVLLAEMASGESDFRRLDEEYRKFQARLSDIDSQVKHAKDEAKRFEQEVVVARRLQGTEQESERWKKELDVLEHEKIDAVRELDTKKRLLSTVEQKLQRMSGESRVAEEEEVREQRKEQDLD